MKAHGILFLLVAASACDAAGEETNQEWNERSMNAVTRALGPGTPPVFRNVRFVGPATCGEYRPKDSEFRRFIGFGPGERPVLEFEVEAELFAEMWKVSCGEAS